MNLKKDYGDAVATYVRDIPPEKWTAHGFLSKLYGWRTTNFVESHNAKLDKNGFRRDSPFQAVQTGVKDAMLVISHSSEQYNECCKASKRFTPHATVLIQKEQDEAGAYEVYKSSAEVDFINLIGHKN